MVATSPVRLVPTGPPYRLFNAVPCVVCAHPAAAFWPSAFVVHGAAGAARCVIDPKATRRIDRQAQRTEAAA